MSDALETVRNLTQKALDTTRDVLESLKAYYEEHEPYATNSINLLEQVLSEIPCDIEDFQKGIEETLLEK